MKEGRKEEKKEMADPEKPKFMTSAADPVRVIASFKARPGQEGALRQVLESLIAPTRSELGCIEYVLYRDAADPLHFVFDELWANMPAFAMHSAMPYIQTLLPRIAMMISEPPRVEAFYRVA